MSQQEDGEMTACEAAGTEGGDEGGRGQTGRHATPACHNPRRDQKPVLHNVPISRQASAF